MAVHVVLCVRCNRRLQAVPADILDLECSDCGLKAPVEAYRWIGSDLSPPEAERLVWEWNPRLVRGLTESEAREFEALAV